MYITAFWLGMLYLRTLTAFAFMWTEDFNSACLERIHLFRATKNKPCVKQYSCVYGLGSKLPCIVFFVGAQHLLHGNKLHSVEMSY